MVIIFDSDTRINIDNVPTSILGIATLYNVNSLGSFFINTECTKIQAESFLREQGFDNLSYHNDANTIVVHRNEERLRGYGLVEAINTAPAVAAPTPVFTHLQEVVTGYDNGNDEDNNEEDEPPVEADAVLTESPSQEIHGTTISDDDIVRVSQSLVSLEQGSSTTLYLQKINEFNRLWGNVVVLKRQIDNLMKVVSDIEVIKTIKSDLEYLSAKCHIIDSVKLMPGSSHPILVITTKEIISAEQSRFGARVVGRMQIVIDLRYLYSPNPPSTNFVRAIDIINIDRNPRRDVYWVCGHANRQATDGPLSVCYGGYFQHIFDAITSKNLPQLFDTIIRFIQNPDENDAWGRNISLFPKAVNQTVGVTNEA